MSGFVVPSVLDRQMLATRKSLAEISDSSKFDQRGIHRLGDGMAVTKDGVVVIEKRSSAQGMTQMENEVMAEKFEQFKNWLLSEGAGERTQELVQKAIVDPPVQSSQTDPNILIPPGGFTPSDLAYEFGTPIDTTEIMALCEDLGVYTAIPEVINGSKTDSWREMSALYNASGTAWIGFTPGGCPDFMAETTDAPKTLDKKHIGKMQSLTESDIQHSIASIAAGYGVRELLGPSNTTGAPSMFRESIRSLLDKEIKKLNILVLNAWDYLLVHGNASTRPLEFSGMETLVTAANGARVNTLLGAYSGTFSATRFDEWLAAGCARPTHLFAHPSTAQAVKIGYWGIHGTTPQAISFTGPGSNIIPGMTFGEVIQTAIGPMPFIVDTRFTRTSNNDGSFNGDIFALRMTHNGEPLVYKATQIPLAYKELTPGCSAISFMVWAVTALTIKWMCAQARYTSKFQGLVLSSDCSYIFGQ